MKSIKKSKGASKRRKRQTQKPKNKRPRKGTKAKAKRNVRKKTRKAGMPIWKLAPSLAAFFSRVPHTEQGIYLDEKIHLVKQDPNFQALPPEQFGNLTNFFKAKGAKDSLNFRNVSPYENQPKDKKKVVHHTARPKLSRGARGTGEYFNV
jgi:hypothetical protein